MLKAKNISYWWVSLPDGQWTAQLLQLVLSPLKIHTFQKVCIKMFRCILISKMSCKEPETIFCVESLKCMKQWHRDDRQFALLKRLTSLRVRHGQMRFPHYVRAWDSVALCRKARMTFRNAIVVYSIPFPNAPCPIRLIVLFSRTRYPRVPGAREGRRGP